MFFALDAACACGDAFGWVVLPWAFVLLLSASGVVAAGRHALQLDSFSFDSLFPELTACQPPVNTEREAEDAQNDEQDLQHLLETASDLHRFSPSDRDRLGNRGRDEQLLLVAAFVLEDTQCHELTLRDLSVKTEEILTMFEDIKIFL